jgi:hypothetical protein
MPACIGHFGDQAQQHEGIARPRGGAGQGIEQGRRTGRATMRRQEARVKHNGKE